MKSPNDPLVIGDWLVDPRDDSVTRGSERVKLEPRTMRLLMRLAQTPGEVVSQDELLESVWTGVVVGTASVYQSMSQLRKVLGDVEEPPRYIETVARKGYRLVAKVAAAPKAAAAIVPDAVPATEVPAVPEPTPRKPLLRWAALALIAVGLSGASWWLFVRDAVSMSPPSIVVLPFTDLSTDKTEQAFCDGLTEETSNWLAQLPTLRVVARTSAFLYRDRGADVRAIGRDLDTTHLLEGSLRRSGDKVRITVQLIETQHGYHVWSASYDTEANDVLKVQEDIARKVADNLELRITAETDSRFADRRTKSNEAQRLYLLAKAHESKQEDGSLERAIELYRAALKEDPTFALARVWLAHALIGERYASSRPIEELAPQIEPLLAEVEKSSPDLVDLYVVRGQFNIEMGNQAAALKDLQYALKLNPNSAAAANKLGLYFLAEGQPRDALTYYTIASSLDPRAFVLQGSRCLAMSDLGAHAMAEAACERARALKPQSSWVYSISSQLAEARGDLEGAIKWSDAALEHGSSIVANQGERARWLVTLGEPAGAGAVYERAFAADAEAVRGSAVLTYGGCAAAVESDGAEGLRSFIRENQIGRSTAPDALLELASASLMVDDVKMAREYLNSALASPNFAPVDLASPWQASGGNSHLLTVAAILRAEGDAAGAEKRLDELSALLDKLANAGVATYGLHYLKAALAAMRGNADAAMLELNQAAQIGWRDAWLADHLPYFDPLRERADYRQLLAAVRAKNAATAAKLKGRLIG